jgi:probable H4MPT-linked C1 transfer pathway protein
MQSILALDIGGANLKLADGCGLARSVPFALWKHPDQLSTAVAELLDGVPHDAIIVATMTGELADCYRTKDDGVRQITQAVVGAAGNRPVHIYRVDGRLVSPTEACDAPRLVAASNWHALASYVARWIDTTGLIVDIGSTTADLIPIIARRSATVGLTDPERLASGELVYTGVVRSPLCAIVDRLPWGSRQCRVAQELFATSWDAYLTLGLLPEQPAATHTADGRPATREFAHDRLARAICADRTTFSETDAIAAAKVVMHEQLNDLAEALHEVIARLPHRVETVIVSGQGEFLAHALVDRELSGVSIVSLSRRLGNEVSEVAPAHALAILAREALAP